MKQSYIPEDKVYAVCTHQMNSSSRKFSYNREEISVFWKGRKHPILNCLDKNIDKNFICKKKFNVWGCFAAFGAGIMIGLSFSLGIIAPMVAILALALFAAFAASHKCTEPLQAGKWFLLHNSVRINGAAAITGASLLKCGNGGILTPFFNEEAASKAAQNIAFNNRCEAALNMGASFLAGYFIVGIGSSFIGLAGGWAKIKAGAILAGKFTSGYILFSTLTWAEREGIRTLHENTGELQDNETYKNINEIDDNTLFAAPAKPDDLIQDSTDLAKIARDPSGKITVDMLPALIAASRAGSDVIQDTQLKAKIQSLDGLTKQQLRTNALAQQLLADLNAGKYPGWKSNITAYNARRMNPSMIDEGITATGDSLKSNLKKLGENSTKGVALMMPFVATYFGEESRADLAKAKNQDSSDIKLAANKPID